MGELSGLKALVTGGASGIGLAVATTFAAEGAAVVVLDRADDRPKELPDEIGYIPADVTDDAAVRDGGGGGGRVLGRARRPGELRRHRRPGHGRGQQRRGVAPRVRRERRRHRAGDQGAALRGAAGVRPGAMVNVSAQSRRPPGFPTGALFDHQRWRWPRSPWLWRRTSCPTASGSTGGQPGDGGHTMGKPAAGGRSRPRRRAPAALEARQPHGRMVRIEEVAGAIADLASPKSGSTTGTWLAVDGGMEQAAAAAEAELTCRRARPGDDRTAPVPGRRPPPRLGLGSVRDQPWTAGSPTLQRSYSLDDLRPQLRANRIDRTVVVQTMGVEEETPDLLQMAQTAPEVGWRGRLGRPFCSEHRRPAGRIAPEPGRQVPRRRAPSGSRTSLIRTGCAGPKRPPRAEGCRGRRPRLRHGGAPLSAAGRNRDREGARRCEVRARPRWQTRHRQRAGRALERSGGAELARRLTAQRRSETFRSGHRGGPGHLVPSRPVARELSTCLPASAPTARWPALTGRSAYWRPATARCGRRSPPPSAPWTQQGGPTCSAAPPHAGTGSAHDAGSPAARPGHQRARVRRRVPRESLRRDVRRGGASQRGRGLGRRRALLRHRAALRPRAVETPGSARR